ncbi:DUF779 domain-containing protein [Bordetella hinzii]|uniref:DUF779 domain-containing protein n=1 Tax=Bordetella hinzii TaxID=103855 RepID=UPI00114EF05E|nr:DUF779 domain-containing protein [Bordetella hinzii]QDJ51189.1 acetaldehyde dehydrogenase [Bordetella hinzii]
MMPRTPRVVATDAGRDLIATLKAKHGPLMFHQSGGCCDGSSPMCYSAGGFMVGATDVLLGELEGCPFYMGEDQFAYWEHTQLIIDAVPGRGGAFSLDSAEGRRFLLRSRLYTDAEWARVAPVTRGA